MESVRNIGSARQILAEISQSESLTDLQHYIPENINKTKFHSFKRKRNTIRIRTIFITVESNLYAVRRKQFHVKQSKETFRDSLRAPRLEERFSSTACLPSNIGTLFFTTMFP